MLYLANTDIVSALRLRPTGGPCLFFSRMRFFGVGQVLEDIDMYNRAHDLFNTFSLEDSRYDAYAEGVRNIRKGFADHLAQTMVGVTNANVVSDMYLRYSRRFVSDRSIQAIERYSSQTEVFSIMFIPITIELSVVDEGADPISLMWVMLVLLVLMHQQLGKYLMCK